MKLLSDITSLELTEFTRGELVTHVMHDGSAIKITLKANEEISCPMCSGSVGYRVLNHHEIWWACKCNECIRRNGKRLKPRGPDRPEISEMMRLGGVPLDYCNIADDEWKHGGDSGPRIISWAKNPKGCLVLSGSCGSGKTFSSAYVIALYLRFNEGTARFFSAVDTKYQWLGEMRSQGPQTLPGKMQGTDLLVIDDLDKVDPSPAFYEFLYLIINSRYASGKPTIVTTNKDQASLRQQLGDALSDRIFDSRGTVIQLTGRNLRQ